MRPHLRPDVSEILPGEIYISSYPGPGDASWLRGEFGIGAVVSLQEDMDLSAKGLSEDELLRAYADAGIVFHRIGIADYDPDDVKRNIERVIVAIRGYRQAGYAVLVHCNAGFNRAPTVVIGYLHRHHAMELKQAERFVCERRRCAPYMDALA